MVQDDRDGTGAVYGYCLAATSSTVFLTWLFHLAFSLNGGGVVVSER